MGDANVQNSQRYVIINSKGGTAIDLSGADNKSIIGYQVHRGANQQWETIKVSDHDGEGWHIRNVAHPDLYLALEGHPRDDVNVIASHQPFKWQLWHDDVFPNTVRICVPNTQENVDLTNYGDSNNGTPIRIWGRWKAQNQVWNFEQV